MIYQPRQSISTKILIKTDFVCSSTNKKLKHKLTRKLGIVAWDLTKNMRNLTKGTYIWNKNALQEHWILPGTSLLVEQKESTAIFRKQRRFCKAEYNRPGKTRPGTVTLRPKDLEFKIKRHKGKRPSRLGSRLSPKCHSPTKEKKYSIDKCI